MAKTTEQDLTIQERKAEHLRIVAEEDVSYGKSSLFECIHLLHEALPELDIDEIDTTTEFFGKKLKAPFMITSMTGGAEFAGEMNRGLAEAASKSGIAFAVGSQRVMLRHPEVSDDFRVRSKIPEGVLLGNIGAVQLAEYSPEVIKGLMDDIEADGMCVHLNVAQELLQVEGHRDFTGITDKIARLVDSIRGKILVKETGAGLSPRVLEKLKSIGVPYIDVSGSGGTSWTRVEKYRAPSPVLYNTGQTLSNWGIPTAFSLIAAKKILDDKTCIISSGGVYNGLDAAKSIAVGADIAGFARPVLLPFLKGGVESAKTYLESVLYELKTAMLLTGSKDLKSLGKTPRIIAGELKDWLNAYGWLGEKGM
ncbi:MAG: type 2 isopentenyl-diphosphate Delta-isomerase [candidate division Zixibacteria bacterium]|nr:type 2 isopentenyl-diphosphate Delta-isomerase [candidate division Zixibacteria bacterium]